MTQVVLIDAEGVCGKHVECSLVVKVIEELTREAKNRGHLVPERVYVETSISHRTIDYYGNEIARATGFAKPSIGPESCLVYVGWTGVPEVYIIYEKCKRYSHIRLQSEAYRVAAHSILHRGLDSYSIEDFNAQLAYQLMGRLYMDYLYLISAGVRAHEALRLASTLVNPNIVAIHVADSLREAIEAYEDLLKEIGESTTEKALVAAEYFKLLAEANALEHVESVKRAKAELLATIPWSLRGVLDVVEEGLEALRETEGLKLAKRVGVIANKMLEKLTGLRA